MLEKDIAHLRFLHTASIKGDVLTQQDYDAILMLETDLKHYLEMIAFIKKQEEKIASNC